MPTIHQLWACACLGPGPCTFIEENEVAVYCQVPVQLSQYKLCHVHVGSVWEENEGEKSGR